MISNRLTHVIPAKAGIQVWRYRKFGAWIPAFAGMTCVRVKGERRS